MTRWYMSRLAVICGRVIIAIAILSSGIANSWATDLRYWVWQRADPLDDDETAELANQKVDTIYWQIGELENIGESWHWKARFDFPASNNKQTHFIPAVRLVSHDRQPFSDASVADLI